MKKDLFKTKELQDDIGKECDDFGKECYILFQNHYNFEKFPFHFSSLMIVCKSTPELLLANLKERTKNITIHIT